MQYPNPHAHPNSQLPFEEETIDLRKYVYLILANWYWFVITISLALGGAYLLNRYTKPVYELNSSLIIDDDPAGTNSFIPGMEIFQTQNQVLNEIDILKSYSMANATLRELNFDISYTGVGRSGFKENYMYTSSPFYVELDTSKVNLPGARAELSFISREEYEVQIYHDEYTYKAVGRTGATFSSEVLTFRLHLKDPQGFDPDEAYDTYYFTYNSLNALTNQYRQKLEIEANDERSGSILYLSLSGLSAEQEADYLNKLMEVYIRQGLDEKNQTAINTVDFIDQQLGVLNTSLQQAEMNLQNFRLDNNLINVSTEGSMIYEKLARLDEERARLELQQRYYAYLKEYVSDQNALNEVVAPSTVEIGDPLLGSLISQLNQQIIDKQELLFTVAEGNPRLELVNQRIRKTTGALLDNINGLIRNNSYAVQEINAQLEEAKKDLQKIPVTERQLISKQREYEVNDEIYTFLLQKRAEAAIAKASNVADNKILDSARPENAAKIAPKSKMNYMIGLVAGIGLPMLILILLDLLNTKIVGHSDIEKKTQVPIVANIGHSELGDIPVFDNPKSVLSESFRSLRTNMQYMLRESGQKTIALTSTVSGEGKTFVSVNLATIFSLAGKRTLLIGMDLRKPKIHKIFNMDNKEGISTFLIGKSEYSDIIFETKIDHLWIAPSGPVPPNPAELIETPRMEEFMERVKNDFDIVIIDTPPFGIVTDALLIGRNCDANLFIVRQNYSAKEVVDLINDIREKNDLKNLGIVLNDLKLKGYYRGGYKYYNYNYTYRYGYLYGKEYYGKE